MLKEILEQVKEQGTQFNLSHNRWLGFAEHEPDSDILYFPRKEVKVRKLRSGPWTPKAWFIDERTNKCSTHLDSPTSLTGKALSSGLRSVIILDDNGNYIRLKGVAPKVHLAQGADRGLCSWDEAFYEQAKVWGAKNLPIIPMEPYYIEGFIPPSKTPSLDFAKQFFSPIPRVYLSSGEKVHDELLGFVNRTESTDGAYVSAFKIKGDTRLDEAIYHLTKKPLRGYKRELRDDLVHMLCFNAGASKAILYLSGASWSHSFTRTNAHIGNFTLFQLNGILDVGLVDLFQTQLKSSFEMFNIIKQPDEFNDHCIKELDCLAEDFEDTTSSLTTQLRWRYFPRKLRQECFQALKTGYALEVTNYSSVTGLIIPNIKLDKPVVPKRVYFSPDEFKQACKEVMS